MVLTYTEIMYFQFDFYGHLALECSFNELNLKISVLIKKSHEIGCDS